MQQCRSCNRPIQTEGLCESCRIQKKIKIEDTIVKTAKPAAMLVLGVITLLKTIMDMRKK